MNNNMEQKSSLMEPNQIKKTMTHEDDTELTGILNLWRKFTFKNESLSTESCHHPFLYHHHHHHQEDEPVIKTKQMMIYLKSPYALSGGVMEGTIILTPIPDIQIMQLELILHGIEIVFDPAHYSTSTHAHHFLHLLILSLQHPQDPLGPTPPEEDTVVPFQFQLPLDLGSSYKDKKASVQYTLQCHARVQKAERTEIWHTERSLQVHQNVRSLKSTDPPSLYHPIRERRRIWERVGEATPSYVDLVMSLSRSIWTSGSSLYVSMIMENMSVHRMKDVKLELIKRQNTFSQTGLHKSFDLMPVTSTCELVACTSLLALGWWKPLDPNEEDHVMIPLEIPMHEFTIKHQKLIDVSFALRVSISSLTSTDAVIEIPITLAHPISADPPPGSLPMQHINYNEVDDASPPHLSTSSTTSSVSSLWSSGSYSPYIPARPTSSPPPPLPPKEDDADTTTPSIPASSSKKKHTVVTACEALVLHAAGKCKSAFFSSTFFHTMKKRPLLQKLSSSFTYASPRVSPSGTLLALAPSQKFEISVQELDLACPASPCRRRHKRFYGLLSMKKKKKNRRV